MKVLTYNNCRTPQRFGSYKKLDGMDNKKIKDLLSQGWLERELTSTEEKRCQNEGCLGDLLDSFETMYGKTVYNR